MIKKVLFFAMAMVLTAVSARAAHVDEAAAREVVRSFMANQVAEGRLRAIVPPAGDIQLIYTEMSSVEVDQPSYYIYNTLTNFYVVAGDDCIPGILVFGDAPIDLSDIPCGLQALLDLYKNEIDYLYSHPGSTPVIASPRITGGRSGDVEPLLTALWSQRAPFNNDCPVSDGETCVTGCCCTSLSMVFYYWKYSNLTTTLNGYMTRSLGLVLPALEPTTFDWNNMIDDYTAGTYTPEQGAAVAKLMRYVGQAEFMDYSPTGSGAYDFNIVSAALKFGYDEGVTCLNKGNYTATQWRSMMLSELRAGRPIVYTANDKNGAGGHAFNVDGYDATNNLYHINFGWGGNGNAYCALNDFSAGSYTFNQMQAMIIGIQPPIVEEPVIEVNTDSLSFSTEVGTAVSESFMVYGEALAGDITVELSDPQGVYSIDKTVITPSEAAECAAVTVTYHPVEAGVNSAVITVSTEGAEPLTITLSGVAEAPAPVDGPVITANVDSLNFGEVTLGYYKTCRFTVTGFNLENDVTLEISGERHNEFVVTPSVITPEDAAAGVVVSVKFEPIFTGEHHPLLTLSSPGAQDLVIPVVATSVEPASTITDNTSRAYTAYVGALHRATTEVVRWADVGIYPPVNPPVLPMVPGNVGDTPNAVANSSTGGVDNSRYSAIIEGDDCFSAYIFGGSATQKTCKVMIMYSPTTAGTHHATLKLYCSGAYNPLIVVTLTGTALVLKSDPVMREPTESEASSSSFVANWTQDCFTQGVSDFSIECVPEGSDFDPAAPDYICLTDLMPNECSWGSGMVSQTSAHVNYRYPITGLTGGQSYQYRVIAHYIDDTWSEWSNVAHVTLLADGILAGDMDGDGLLTENDVALLSHALTEKDAALLNIPAADVNGDGTINIQDIVDLLDLVLANY